MTEELIRELKALFRDYDVSPRGRGRRFPDPVKSRIIGLLQSGTSAWKLSRATGISVATLRTWKGKSANANFDRIEVKPSKPVTARIHVSEKAWIELDLEAINADFLQKIRACL
jgi:hypothetical protein